MVLEVTVKYKGVGSNFDRVQNKGLELIAVQVLELVEYETDDDEF